MDLGGPPVPAPTAVPVYSASSGLDLLGGGLDSLLSDPVAAPPPVAPASVGLLGDIFGLTAPAATSYVPPKQIWLPAARGKGLEISGNFYRSNGQIMMDMTFTNRAMQPMMQFAIQLNKNSFGLVPAQPLQVVSPLAPNQAYDSQLILNPSGVVQRMEPLTNLQVRSLPFATIHF